jgi:hypothetical protein
MRHPTHAAIEKFDRILGLPHQPGMQDWEIECADPDRVEEFLRCYDEQAANDDERFTLMALILGSFEEYHGTQGPSLPMWRQIKTVLERDLAVHRDHIIYYACPESDVPEDWCFPITPLMRELLPKCLPFTS